MIKQASKRAQQRGRGARRSMQKQKRSPQRKQMQQPPATGQAASTSPSCFPLTQRPGRQQQAYPWRWVMRTRSQGMISGGLRVATQLALLACCSSAYNQHQLHMGLVSPSLGILSRILPLCSSLPYSCAHPLTCQPPPTHPPAGHQGGPVRGVQPEHSRPPPPPFPFPALHTPPPPVGHTNTLTLSTHSPSPQLNTFLLCRPSRGTCLLCPA